MDGRDDPAEAAPAVDLKPDGPVDQLMSAALWGAGGAWLAGMLLPMTVLHRFIPTRRMEWWSRTYAAGQLFFTGSRMKYVVDPAIDAGRQYMYFQNHVNHFDHIVMYRATPHVKQGVENEDHFKYPIYGTFMKGRGTIPVRRGEGGKERLREHMRAEMDLGHSILVFPEGTRTTNGRLGDFRSGVFRIAQQLGAPIIPTTVCGNYRVMRKGSLLIRPGYDIHVYCDAPVETADYPDEAQLPELIDRVHGVMRRRIDEYWQSSEPKPKLL